jgi:hypothetical protein
MLVIDFSFLKLDFSDIKLQRRFSLLDCFSLGVVDYAAPQALIR